MVVYQKSDDRNQMTETGQDIRYGIKKFGSWKQKTDFKGGGNALFAAQYFLYLVRQVRQVKGLLNKSTVAVV